MAKHVNTSGDYSIKTANAGTITLDTGNTVGQVQVTGDLVVNGTTLTVNSTDLNINDNIIVLNAGEAGTGVTLGESGIRIERGSLADVQFLFNESIVWNDPVSNTTKSGAFVFKDESNANIGLECRSISTGGGDLFLINAGTGVVSVSGTNNYEVQVEAHGDDALTNKKYVTDHVATELATHKLSKIQDGDINPTMVLCADDQNTGLESDIKVTVDSINNVTFYNNRTELHDIRISNNTIETTNSQGSLVLQAPGTGSVVVDDQLQILSTPSPDDPATDPTAPSDGIKLYVKTPGIGKTGLFYVNSSNVRDELLSKNRSLLLSMIF
jgi:hypothetical protein|tara:strand:- start:2426 stop:3403 length:978 start_codon:yes stop_codon:yes gene_type:complete